MASNNVVEIQRVCHCVLIQQSPTPSRPCVDARLPSGCANLAASSQISSPTRPDAGRSTARGGWRLSEDSAYD